MGSAGVSLLSQLLLLDPVKRINAIDAIQHEYFRVEPLPLKPGEVPKFNDSHELDGKKNRNRGVLPPAPAGGAVGAPNDWSSRDPAWHNSGRRPDQWTNGVNSRRPPPESRIPPSVPHREHRPAWSKGSSSDHPANLPPRPPVGDSRDSRRDRGRDDRHRGGSGPPRDARQTTAEVDTYFPSYGADDRRPPPGSGSHPPPRAWDRDRDRGHGHERRRDGSRDPGADRRERGYSGGPPPQRGMSRERDRDQLHDRNLYRR